MGTFKNINIMKIIFLTIFLILAVSAQDRDRDVECFNSGVTINHINKKGNKTFEVRIEHAGSLFDIADWFNNGDVFAINSTDFKYNTTAKAMDEVCTAFGEWCTDKIKTKLNTIGKIQRWLTIGYNGEEVYAGMALMNIILTKDSADYEWVRNNCTFFHQNASLDMTPMEFSYINWDTSGMPETILENISWKPQDKLKVHGGVTGTLASFVTVLGVFILGKLI